MHFILVILVLGGYAGSSPSLTSPEFNTKQACEGAKVDFIKHARLEEVWPAKPTIRYIKCMPKG